MFIRKCNTVTRKVIMVLSLLFLALVTQLFCQVQSVETSQRTYVVNYTKMPPVIDGILSPGEWVGASPAQGDFRLLGSGAPAQHKYSLQALWDDTNLYIALTSSETDIPSQEGFPGDDATNTWPGFVFRDKYEDVEFFFDPGDLADNVSDENKGDSYQIAVQLVNGVRPAGTVQPPYLFTAARYNTLYGGITWNPGDIAVAVNLKNGITLEIAIPFSNLNMRYGKFLNADMGETDLEISGPPKNGDRWAFQAGRFKSDKTVPVWSYHPGKAIALHPYGIFTFAGKEAAGTSSTTPSPFVSPNPAPGVGLPPFNTAQPAPSISGAEQKRAEFKEGLPPLLTSGTLSIAAAPATPLIPSPIVFDKIDEGLQAIKQERRPGILLLTNPRDEFDQRVELILALPVFKNAISNMVMIRVDIDKDPRAMMHYGFYKTPSFVLFDSEGNLRRKIQSVTDLESLLQELQNLK